MQWPLIGRQSDLDHAVALVEAGTGLALLGPAGVGKSRLLHELGDRAERSGKAVVRAVATESTRSIPFAPLVDLLPAGPTPDPLAMMGMALRSLEKRNRGRGLLLSVDDGHDLDPVSLGFLVQAVAADVATVCLTVRSSEPMAPELVDMWTNGVIERLDLGSLSFEEMKNLIAVVLGTTEPGLVDDLWRLSEGNPLVLHEMVEGAIGTSLEKSAEGVWRSTGPLARSARLADLVGSRLGALPPQVRPGMDMVAVGAPLPVAFAQSALEDAFEVLEEKEMVSIVGQGDEKVVVSAHPMYGEVLVENLTESRKSQALARLVEVAVEGTVQVDPLRAAVWQAEAGLMLSPELALSGGSAAMARHDAVLAESLVQAIDDDPRATLLLARSYSYQQRWDDAESLFASMTDVDGDFGGEIASIRAQNLAFGLGRVLEGREYLEIATRQARDPDLRARLINERAMLSAISGDFADTRAAAGAVLSDAGAGEVARVAAYVSLTIAQAMTGDSLGLEGDVSEAVDLADRVSDVLPFAKDQIEIMQLVALINAGRIDESLDLAESAISREGRGDAMRTTWMSAACLAFDVKGLHEQGKQCARTALELYARADPFGLEPQARGILAMARAQQGDGNADAGIRELPLHHPAPRLSVWIDRGKAWAEAARGDIHTAVQILCDAGRHAIAGEHFAWGLLCFHDVVRLGRPEEVIDDIRSLPDMPGARLLDLLRGHATALAGEDLDELSRIADGLTVCGAHLLAAEVWAQVADLAKAPERQARAGLRSMILQRSCEQATTPALTLRPRVLTPREFDIAVAAGSGLSSPEIAESRFVSTRTVDNHLRSVYRKTGIGSREELAEIMGSALGLAADQGLD